jgi:hypothetical protein
VSKSLGERVGILEDWRTGVNGQLDTIEKKVDRLLFWLLGGMLTILLTLLGILLPLALAR